MKCDQNTQTLKNPSWGSHRDCFLGTRGLLPAPPPPIIPIPLVTGGIPGPRLFMFQGQVNESFLIPAQVNKRGGKAWGEGGWQVVHCIPQLDLGKRGRFYWGWGCPGAGLVFKCQRFRPENCREHYSPGVIWESGKKWQEVALRLLTLEPSRSASALCFLEHQRGSFRSCEWQRC